MDNPVHPYPWFETDEMNDVSAVINIRYHVMVKNKNDRRHKLSNWGCYFMQNDQGRRLRYSDL